MQLVGSRFTDATAILGNDLVTLPDFPAEIRAPAGTLHGVSAFQIHFASRDILTPGDHPNVLIAMNPAALKTNIGALEKGGTLIVNEDAFNDNNLRKAGYDANPLKDGSLDDYQLFIGPDDHDDRARHRGHRGDHGQGRARTKNVFALGLVSWMYGRPTELSIDWIEKKFAGKPGIRDANLAAFRAGYNFGETAELLAVHYEVKPAPPRPGHLPQHQRHERHGDGTDRREREAAGCRCSYAATRSRRRPSCCTSCLATRSLACVRCRRRTRSRPREWSWARRSAAASG